MSFTFGFDLPSNPSTTSNTVAQLGASPSSHTTWGHATSTPRVIHLDELTTAPAFCSISVLTCTYDDPKGHFRVVKNVEGVIADLPEGSDLVPGVYEGGLKIWESSKDLVCYLQNQRIIRPLYRVLELGCGHGLPGIHALQQGADSVVFSDLNEEVLREVTRPNIFLNVANRALSSARISLICGDWEALPQILGVDKPVDFNVIISAETFYTPAVTNKLLRCIHRYLAKTPEALALVAGKRYYFGTGGSVANLMSQASALGMRSRVVASSEDGRSNIRDIVEIRCKMEGLVRGEKI